MKTRGIFIAGTDTGVGKTLVSAAILTILRERGFDAVPMKPVQTGAKRRGPVWFAPDLDFCLAAARMKPTTNERRLMSPCCFSKPCSPHLAAAIEGRRISIAKLLRSFEMLERRHEVVVAEGAGGLLVPISAGQTMLDLIKALALPVVLVARSGLGTINHTLLSLAALEQAGLSVLGVVFNKTEPSMETDIENNNADIIKRMGNTRILARIPYAAGIDNPRRVKAFAEHETRGLLAKETTKVVSGR
jgi:dethiobiotin synthetase